MFATAADDAPLKAIDFGISVFCEPGQVVDLRAGTPIYIAPEVLRSRYSLPADLWSLGIVSGGPGRAAARLRMRVRASTTAVLSAAGACAGLLCGLRALYLGPSRPPTARPFARPKP